MASEARIFGTPDGVIAGNSPENQVGLEDGRAGIYRVHRLLFDLRWDDALVERFAADPAKVLRAYGLEGDLARAVRERDVAALAAAGVNPYLLYFGAVRLGLTRDQYYEALRAPTPT